MATDLNSSITNSEDDILDVLAKQINNVFNDLFEYESNITNVNIILDILRECCSDEDIINKTKHLYHNNMDARISILYLIKHYNKNNYILVRAIIHYVKCYTASSSSTIEIKSNLNSPVFQNDILNSVRFEKPKSIINRLKHICWQRKEK